MADKFEVGGAISGTYMYDSNVTGQFFTEIKRRADGSFEVVYNGYPYHATELDTPDVYRQILADIEAGVVPEDLPAPMPVRADLEARERIWRDSELERVKWLRERHRDEVELGLSTTLAVEQYEELLAYMQDLRTWPQSTGFPDDSERPVVPAWVDAAPASASPA